MAITVLLFSIASALFSGSYLYIETGSLLTAFLGYSWGGAGVMIAFLLAAIFDDQRASAHAES